MKPAPKIGLALSGGGARAMAFHLGCLRALHDRGVLNKVSVLSTVSGGSVIGALYAFDDEPFEAFEKRVETALRRGLLWGIVRHTLLSTETPKIVVAILAGGLMTLLGRAVQLVGMLLRLVGIGRRFMPRLVEAILDVVPRFASRTTAFERHLAKRYFGDRRMNDVARKGLNVVINAAELRTESAFRFGSQETATWRFGQLTAVPRVATAVAASAAFPALLPAIDRRLEFEKKGVRSVQRAIITDGGVYDNFGISCLVPGRSGEFTSNVFPVDFIIACDAGTGIPSGARRPYFMGTRMLATTMTIHRRTQTLMQNLLHRMAASGEIDGFLLPYLGMQDERLPVRPTDLVTREEVADYPTDFSPMTALDIEKLSQRGEQLTRCLLDAYATHL